MRTIILIVLSGLLVAIASGCAGGREKQAFTELAAIEKNIYQSSADRESADDASLTIADTASLELFLRYAALNNPNLEAAFNRWKAALERVPQARSLPDPRFTYGYFIREVETRVGPQQHRLSIAQMLPWFGKLGLQGDSALETANAAQAEYDAAKLKLFYQVKEAYYEYSYLARAIEVMEENVELMGYLENVVLAKYRVGTAPHSDLIKVQVELDKLQDQLKSMRDLMNPVKARLNTALNRPTKAQLPVPGKVGIDTVQISSEQLSERLKESNPELKGSRFLTAKEKFSVDLAKKNYLPDITLGVDYIITGEARMPGMRDSGKDPLIAMLSINLPLWWGKSKASVNEAKARYQSALNQTRNSENELLSRLEMVLYQFREAKRKIGLYEDALLPRAQQALNVTQTAFETDKVDFLNLIDAQRTYLEFELSLERAKFNYAQRVAELEMLVGREIPTRGK
jgi:outer membrane protein TolC